MNNYCDPEAGECAPGDLPGFDNTNIKKFMNAEIIYVGDPMCSWCWGISPALKKLRDHYKQQGVDFSIIAGGLRPGGGDEWNEDMKNFLKHHWEEVQEKSGQPFGYQLFEKENFNYDTEPSCRAVVTARYFLKDQLLEFFEAIQKKFYVDNEDPTQLEFYKSVCEHYGIDFSQFSGKFEEEEVKKQTYEEFKLNRSWGVRGFPAVILKANEQLFLVTRGYNTFEEMKTVIDKILDAEKEKITE